jgi:hypothetical protein
VAESAVQRHEIELLARAPSKDRADASNRRRFWGDTFAGAILAAAEVVHLLSGGAADFLALSPGLNYPLACALAGAGFLMILIDAVIMVDPDPASGRCIAV